MSWIEPDSQDFATYVQTFVLTVHDPVASLPVSSLVDFLVTAIKSVSFEDALTSYKDQDDLKYCLGSLARTEF